MGVPLSEGPILVMLYCRVEQPRRIPLSTELRSYDLEMLIH